MLKKLSELQEAKWSLVRKLCVKFVKKDSHFSGIFGGRAARRTDGRTERKQRARELGMFFFLSDIGLAACQRLDDHMDL